MTALGVLGVLLRPGWAAADPDAPRLRVSGSAALTVEAREAGEGYEVSVAVVDEVGHPVPNAELQARARGADGQPELRRCGEGRGEGRSELRGTTDAAGHFCLSLRGMVQGSLELRFEDPRGFYRAATRSVQLPEAAADAFELAFDPPVSALQLDEPLQRVGLLARGRPGTKLPEASELVLSLVADGKQRELTRVALDELGAVHRLSLVSQTFGHPGPARLVAQLYDRGGHERAVATAAVLRTATVALELRGTETSVAAGATFDVTAASALGPADSGVVEVRSRGRSITAARIAGGVAHVTLPKLASEALGSTVTLEYVGEGPGWLSGAPLQLEVKAAPHGYARHAPWIVAALLAALAVLLSWRQPQRTRPRPPPPPVRVRASVEVVQPIGEGGGYRGVVCDAHDGTPVCPALIAFVAPGNGAVLLQLRSAADGSFATQASSFPAGTQIEVTAPQHANLVAPLPKPAVLQLSVVSRRRALLDRLVRWADRHGKPWLPSAGDPTPAQVAAAAVHEHEPRVARWARAVEDLAYGPNAPDAAREMAEGVSEDPKLGRG